MKITKTEVSKNMLFGEIEEVGHKNKTYLLYALDLANNIIHLFDDGEHASTSLINLISSGFKNQILNHLGIENTGVRCFIYQEGITGEYCFIKEENGVNPFIEIRADERHLIYNDFYEKNIKSKK